MRLTNFSDLSSCATKRLIFGLGFQLLTTALSMILFEGWGQSFVSLQWHYMDRCLKRSHFIICKTKGAKMQELFGAKLLKLFFQK